MSITEPLDGCERGGMQACPACAVAPSAQRLAEMAALKDVRLVLSLPTAHCAACIVAVEQAVQAVEGVNSARVNLTMKRLSVDAEAGVTAEGLISVLAGVGYEAHELDPGLLSATETDRQGREFCLLYTSPSPRD